MKKSFLSRRSPTVPQQEEPLFTHLCGPRQPRPTALGVPSQLQRALSFPVGSKGKLEAELQDAIQLPPPPVPPSPPRACARAPPPSPAERTRGRRGGLCKASRGLGRRGRPPMNSPLFPARDCTAPSAPAVLASASRAWEGGGRLGCGEGGTEPGCQQYLRAWAAATAPVAPLPRGG